MCLFLGNVEEVERVSIIPRGQTWAATIFRREPDEFYTFTTREKLREKIAVLLSGIIRKLIILYSLL